MLRKSLLLWLVSVSPVVGATFCVDSAEGLHQALADAQANGEGDLVRIVQGTYAGAFSYEDLDGQRLRMEGGYTAGCADRSGDASTTVLDGGGIERPLAVSSESPVEVAVGTLTVANGFTTLDGGGMLVDVEGGEVRLVNLRAVDSSAEDDGGGVSIHGADVADLDRITAIGNVASDRGGGVHLRSNETTKLRRLELVANDSGSLGGGLFVFAPIVDAAEIYAASNVAGSVAGGVYFMEETSEIDEHQTLANSTIEDNQGFNVGGFTSTGSTSMTVIGNRFTRNEATIVGGGGASVSSFVDTYIADNLFLDNSAARSAGGLSVNGAEYNTDEFVSADIARNIFDGNVAQSSGGGVFIQATNLAMFRENQVSRNATIESSGGGAYVVINDSVSLVSNAFFENEAGWSAGGATVSNFDEATVSNNSFVANRAEFVANPEVSGTGGLTVAGYDDEEVVRVYNNLFWLNETPGSPNDLVLGNDGNSNGTPSDFLVYGNAFDHSEAGYEVSLPIVLDLSNLDGIDPQLQDPAVANYRLSSDSSMIDVGSLDAPDLGEDDADASERIFDGDTDGVARVDIGAYEHVPSRLRLTVEGECPGEITLEIEEATPLEVVLVTESPFLGSSPILRGVCAGSIVEVSDPALRLQLSADETGSATSTLTLPSEACQHLLQAIDTGDCTTSPVVLLP